MFETNVQSLLLLIVLCCWSFVSVVDSTLQAVSLAQHMCPSGIAGIQIEQPFAVLPLDNFSRIIELNVQEEILVRSAFQQPV